jgi:hypothetical protein
MKLDCPKCAAEISAENMNLDRMVAKCGRCHSVFSFADHFGYVGSKTKLAAPQPDKVKMENWGGGLTLQWRWFNWMILLLTAFAIFWNGMMFSFVGGSLFSGGEGDFFMPFPFLCFPHFWVGLALLYYVLTGYINKTTVTVDHNQLTVRHGPLPWWGNKQLNTAEIVQLYAKQNFGRSYRSNGWSGNFEVHAVMKQGKHQKLLSGLDSSEHVLFVEQVIEDYLGIVDYPVRGEYGR